MEQGGKRKQAEGGKSPRKATGAFSGVIKSWEDLRKAGGAAFSPEYIRRFLEEDTTTMLTREEVLQRTEEYFNGCVSLVTDEKTGAESYVWSTAPTKSGYAIALGLNRDVLLNYVNGFTGGDARHSFVFTVKEKYHGAQRIATEDFDILRKAVSLIETFYESKLTNGNPVGSIFWLKTARSREWMENRIDRTNAEREVLSIDAMPNLREIEMKDGTDIDTQDVISTPQEVAIDVSEDEM